MKNPSFRFPIQDGLKKEPQRPETYTLLRLIVKTVSPSISKDAVVSSGTAFNSMAPNFHEEPHWLFLLSSICRKPNKICLRCRQHHCSVQCGFSHHAGSPSRISHVF